MMKTKLYIVPLLALCLLQSACKGKQHQLAAGEMEKESAGRSAIHPEESEPLEIGYGLAIENFDLETLTYSSAVGVDHVEASGMGSFVDATRNFTLSDAEITEKLTRAKEAADKAGINIWSIHMPFGAAIDLSLPEEEQRQQVVVMHKKLLGFLKILEPEVILFHPSYYLGVGEREFRKEQLLRSVLELDKEVQAMGAVMVLENMLGPELLKDDTRERPLLRNVEETREFFSRLPESIGLSVDTNHISRPEELILALGERLKSLHIADGTGKAENHWFPCHDKGDNDWKKILAALEKVNYKGPFMFESSPADAREYLACYQRLYRNYRNNEIK